MSQRIRRILLITILLFSPFLLCYPTEEIEAQHATVPIRIAAIFMVLVIEYNGLGLLYRDRK
jgi:hypothetical protein